MTTGLRLKRAMPFAIAIGIWFSPVPAGLTAPAWHLFAVFAAAIASVLIGAFPLLTASMLAVGAIVLTGTITPAQAYSGFANSSVLLVVIAFIVAQAVVKSGLGRRISLFMVSRFGGSSLGLAYSIVLTDAAIAPAFPSNTARGGVLFPIVLSVAKGAGSKPEDPEGRRLGGYLMFCAMASLAVSSALWMTATSCNPIGVQIVQKAGLEIDFGKWFLASAVPSLIAIGLLPLIVAKIFPPRVGKTPEAPAAARKELAGMGTHVARRVDHGRDLRADGRRLGVRQQAEPQHDQRRVHGLRRAAARGRDHARRHRQAGRHAGDVPLARGPLRHERAAERARLHGLRRRAPRLGPGRPVVDDPVRDPDRRSTSSSTTCS